MVQTEGSGYKRWYTRGEWYRLKGLVINGDIQKVSGTNCRSGYKRCVLQTEGLVINDEWYK